MKKLSLRTQLILIICLIMIPMCILIISMSMVSLNNSEERLKDSYYNQLGSFERLIENVTINLKLETDAFLKKNSKILLKSSPMEPLTVIGLVDELRTIWKRTDLVLGAYLKMEDKEEVLITHNDEFIPFHEVEELKTLILERNFQEDLETTVTVKLIGGKHYWIWSYPYERYTIGFVVPLDYLVEVLEDYGYGEEAEIYITTPDDNIIATNVEGRMDFYAQKKNKITFSGELAYIGNRIHLMVPRQLISETIPFTIRILQFAGIFATVLIPLLWFSIKFIILDSLERINHAMKEIEQENLDYRLHWEKANSLEIRYIERRFNDMVQQIQNLRIEKYEIEIKKKEIETMNLKLQINPHLLLNSLSLIASLAKISDFKTIQKYTVHLASYFRYTLRNPDAMVALVDEIKFVKTYLEIQKIRYPNMFIVIYDIEEELEQIRIPSLLIENFVENTIKHALKIESEIEVIIIVRSEDDNLVISITDNGNGMSEDVLQCLRKGDIIVKKTGKHIGIWNIRRRLHLNYGERVELNVSSKLNSGTQIWLKIPKEGEENHESTHC